RVVAKNLNACKAPALVVCLLFGVRFIEQRQVPEFVQQDPAAITLGQRIERVTHANGVAVMADVRIGAAVLAVVAVYLRAVANPDAARAHAGAPASVWRYSSNALNAKYATTAMPIHLITLAI